ncbi:MAG: hypothetical protein JW860_07365 [Sedimentisphaerales bacterium]|nr:hypothetical protein [Sedimentisphaerales bacterium]
MFIIRKGNVYVLTLAAALVLTALALALSVTIRQARRSALTDTQADRAEIYAELGIRHAIHYTTVEPLWRQLLNSGTWLNDIPVDNATYTVTGIDPVDGVLVNYNSDPVQLTFTASLDGIDRTVTVETIPCPLEILDYTIACEGDVVIKNHVQINGDVYAGGEIDKSGSDTWIFGNAEAGDEVDETRNISGVIVNNAEAKTFPTNLKIRQYYIDHATEVPYQELIEYMLITPTFNPLGDPNPDGLYYMNTGTENNLIIKNCRIIGTLVVTTQTQLNVKIEVAVNWQPARPDYPVLIVLGSDSYIEIKIEGPVEETANNQDLSLPDEPGSGTAFDIYESKITGLIYCENEIKIKKDCIIQGSVIAGNFIELEDDTICEFNPDIPRYYPPPCFRDTYLMPVRGTWRPVIPE